MIQHFFLMQVPQKLRSSFLRCTTKSVSLFYSVLSEYVGTSTNFLKVIWERELNIQVPDEDRNMARKNAKSLSICNKVKAFQLKILHRAHISPSRCSSFGADFSPFCPKCKTEIGSLTHCLWFCNKIQRIWFLKNGVKFWVFLWFQIQRLIYWKYLLL